MESLKDMNFDYAGMIKAGFGVYVARIEIDYKKPAFVDDVLEIRSKPIKKGAVSGVFAQEVWRDDDLLVSAKVTWAFVDSNGAPVKIPPQWDAPGLKPDN